MINQCPGQDKRNLKAEIINCFHCGYSLEMFSDELKIICPNCRCFVYKKRAPSCIDWCKAACECIGKERFKQLKEGNFTENT